MVSIIAKIEALLALTTSPNIDEARNAALAAAKLIREHQVLLLLPARGAPVSFPEPKVKASVRRRKPSPPAVPKDKVPKGWKLIKAKFEGFCPYCRVRIEKDQAIMWSKEDGALHDTCFAKRQREWNVS